MAPESSHSSERALAQQGQEKFEFYLLSLVFTLLALAVQTATFGSNYPRNALELTGWLFFLVSGLSGLYRLQWIPVARGIIADHDSINAEVRQLKELQIKGQKDIFVLDTQRPQPISERLANRDSAITQLNTRIKQLERRVQIGFEIHKYTFVCGLFSIVAARAYEPILALASAICA